MATDLGLGSVMAVVTTADLAAASVIVGSGVVASDSAEADFVVARDLAAAEGSPVAAAVGSPVVAAVGSPAAAEGSAVAAAVGSPAAAAEGSAVAVAVASAVAEAEGSAVAGTGSVVAAMVAVIGRITRQAKKLRLRAIERSGNGNLRAITRRFPFPFLVRI